MKKYEIFLKAAETGNITRTAEIMNYTQSGVSHAISALEKETGFPVFIRNKSGVTLTANGEKILPEIRAMVNQYEKLTQTILNLNGKVEGTIRIAAFPSIITEIIPDALKEFTKKYPKTSFELMDGTYDEICANLEKGRVDIAFLPVSYARQYQAVPLMEDNMLAVLSEHHPLAEKNSISIEELLKYPIISQYKGCRQLLDDAFVGHKVQPAHEFTDDRAALEMIRQGFGVGIITDSMLRSLNIPVTVRNLNPQQKRKICMATTEASDMQTNLQKVFIRHMLDFVNRNS